VKKRGLEW
jgi:hypothetical protein